MQDAVARTGKTEIASFQSAARQTMQLVQFDAALVWFRVGGL